MSNPVTAAESEQIDALVAHLEKLARIRLIRIEACKARTRTMFINGVEVIGEAAIRATLTRRN